jgi:hypothetical protein
MAMAASFPLGSIIPWSRSQSRYLSPASRQAEVPGTPAAALLTLIVKSSRLNLFFFASYITTRQVMIFVSEAISSCTRCRAEARIF